MNWTSGDEGSSRAVGESDTSGNATLGYDTSGSDNLKYRIPSKLKYVRWGDLFPVNSPIPKSH